MTEPRHSIITALPAIANLSNRQDPTIEWLKAPDGAKLGCRIWQGRPEDPIVLYLHGVEGHSQWFENTASVLNSKGITVYAPDRRGSGMNGTLKGHLENYQTLLQDLEFQLKHIRKQHRGQRVILIANCWSAKLACVFAQSDYQSSDNSIAPPLAGLVLTAPAIYSRVDLPLPIKLQIAMAYLLRSHALLNYYPIPLTLEMLTKNDTFIQFLKADPLRLTKATASFYAQTFFLTKRAQQSAKKLKLPILVLQGEEDRIVDLEKLETWYEQIASTDKAIHVFPGADHSLDFDKSWFTEYTHTLTNWILTKGQLGV